VTLRPKALAVFALLVERHPARHQNELIDTSGRMRQ
jgi:hypothetical protein